MLDKRLVFFASHDFCNKLADFVLHRHQYRARDAAIDGAHDFMLRNRRINGIDQLIPVFALLDIGAQQRKIGVEIATRVLRKQCRKAVLDIERAAFLDGYYFSFAIRYCKLCKSCAVDQGKSCPTPEKIRPCDESFGIDVVKTVRNQGLPCDVLQSKEDIQNRYGFVLIE